MTTDPQKLFSLYERGVITEMELQISLVEIAPVVSPAEFAVSVPKKTLEGIREMAERPRDPRTIRNVTVIRGSNWTKEKEDEEQAEQDRVFREGLNLWRAYFKTAAPSGLDRD